MPDGADSPLFQAMSGAVTRISLRILATTDMHMHVLPYDYLADRASDHHGLARTATLIATRRAEVSNTILLDNGDFLQGNPLGDFAAGDGAAGKPHPAIAAMNILEYDAVTLGNHEFNYGLPFLRRALGQARFPVVSTNLDLRATAGIARYTVLQRRVLDRDGAPVMIRIGVLGFLPPQTTEWDLDLAAQARCDDIIESCGRVLPLLRAEGVDLVVALAHSGIGPLARTPRMENAATALASVDGIDVVIAGHTHQVFPGPHIQPGPGIDPVRGTLAGKPAVMAGFGGSHLGMIDLELERPRGRPTRIAAFQCRAEQVVESVPPLPGIAAVATPMHRATLRHIRRRVGHSTTALHSYFTLIGDDRVLRLVNLAQRWHVRDALKGGPFAHLPILAAAAPFRAGGRGGPRNYTDVAPGSLTLRNISDLYLFPNRICAIGIDGAALADWLERSASIFHQITPGMADQPLLDPDFPSYNFDVIDGVTWRVDPSAPARFLADGRPNDPQSCRIRDLRFRGRPVAPEDRFILATNSYRLANCGLFAPLIAENAVALPPGMLTRDVLHRYVQHRRRITIDAAPAWQFQPMPDTSVLFETGPGALPYLERSAATLAHRIEPVDFAGDGFARMRLHL